MRPKERIDPFLEKFGNLWKEHQDMRFGQLVENLLSVYVGGRLDKYSMLQLNPLLWAMEESEWEKAIEEFYEVFK